MRSFNEISPEDAKKIKYVLCDIDDTITKDGKLPADSYLALWRLHDAGIHVIPVTGRPAGWCDMIVRQWPVRAVIGENGAFAMYFEGAELKTCTHPLVSPAPQARLCEIRDAVLKAVPGCRVAKDQFSRVYDMAIDFREDEPHLGFDDAEKIRYICLSLGANAKVSSIHVNYWFGDYDKVGMAKHFFSNILGEQSPEDVSIFFGDSPNDEPMFEFFPLSCAVANILEFSHSLKHFPRFITSRPASDGFVEAVDCLLGFFDGTT